MKAPCWSLVTTLFDLRRSTNVFESKTNGTCLRLGTNPLVSVGSVTQVLSVIRCYPLRLANQDNPRCTDSQNRGYGLHESDRMNSEQNESAVSEPDNNFVVRVEDERNVSQARHESVGFRRIRNPGVVCYRRLSASTSEPGTIPFAPNFFLTLSTVRAIARSRSVSRR